jgi:hypothetical protein
VIVDARAQLDFLDLDGLLLLARLGGLLLLQEAELAVIEDFADRGRRVRRDLHEIEARVLRNPQGVEEGHDAPVLPRIIDQLHFADTANISVGARAFFLRHRQGSHWTTNGSYLLLGLSRGARLKK